MASINEILGGLEILKKYVEGDDDAIVEGHHNVILTCVLVSEVAIDSEDGEALTALGWHCDHDDCWVHTT